MSGDVLSQAEVENLLSAMDGEAEDAPVAGPLGPTRSREKVTVYDFKRPERVGKEQMRALQTMHEGFGRNFGAALSALLRTIVEVKLTSVDQLTYSEFVFSLENPTCFNLINAQPLEGQLILDINPSILFPSSIVCLVVARPRRRRRGDRLRKSSCDWFRESPTCFSTKCSMPGRMYSTSNWESIASKATLNWCRSFPQTKLSFWLASN